MPDCRSPHGHYTVLTLEEAAKILGLSRQRVYEIEKRALRKLRQALDKEMEEFRV